jgi:predicted transposase/invertase (TIGR01784 family)
LKVNDVKGYIYLNVEHQSTPQELMPFRMLRYKVAIMQQHLARGNKKLPAVIPMLFYHGKGPYPYSLRLIDCFEDPEFAKEHFFDNPLTVDLNLTSDEEIYKHKKLAFLEIVQKHIFSRDLDYIADHIAKLVKITQPEHDLFNSLVYYMLLKGEATNVNSVIEKLKTIENYEEDVMNAAQQLKQQGLQQGREEGREEGEYLKATTIAKKLIAQGRSIQYIQDLTNLPENEIINLVELEKA